ncbi:MAG: 50S ribosomal protein L32 [Candidatus Uhrbacteria bacterium]
MALPGHRRTSSDKRRRASHFALKKLNLAACPSCQAPIRQHCACASCGMYKGRRVITIKDRSKKTSRNTRAGKK